MSAVMQTDNSRELKPVRTPGRPSLYSAKALRRAKEYAKHGYNVIPTVAGLCVHLGIGKKTLYTWLKHEDKKELAHTVDRMESKREALLLEGGLGSKLNSNIVKLILTTNHGYSENNQKDTGITVNVNRSAAITHEDNTLTIDVED